MVRPLTLFLLLTLLDGCASSNVQGGGDLPSRDPALPEEGEEALDATEDGTAEETSATEGPTELYFPDDSAFPGEKDAYEVGQDLFPPLPSEPLDACAEPPKLEVKWLTALVASDPADDPVWKALEEGTFVPPAGPGIDQNGITWFETKPGQNGYLGWTGFGMFYAVTKVFCDAPTAIMVRADDAYRVYLNGRVYLPDFYKSRKHFLPMLCGPEEGVIVIEALGGSAPEAEVFEVSGRAFLNLKDLTAPDLVLGSKDPQYLGISVLSFMPEPLSPLRAKVKESAFFKESIVEVPSLPALSVVQVPFRLEPKEGLQEGPVEVEVALESDLLGPQHYCSIPLQVVTGKKAYKRTKLSKVDNSVQYFAVLPPAHQSSDHPYGLVLSLHGAGVEAIGMAQAYSQKDFAYIVAPTNRRPFGFDWEEWGRLDAMETLDIAMSTFPIDPTRVYVTGHSMGGHGTWHLGVLFPGRFAVVGPSAGWVSFYTYAGEEKPYGPFARARAASDTLNYVENLFNRTVYILHGEDDKVVPINEAKLMLEVLSGKCEDLHYHFEPQAGHWWDKDEAEGVDCVDWPELFEIMENRTLDPYELDFSFKTPSPYISDRYSFVRIITEESPYDDCRVTSRHEALDTVVLTTSNVRALSLDGKVLLSKGIKKAQVDGKLFEVTQEEIFVGTKSKKAGMVHGPINQVFQQPFCFIYPDDDDFYRHYGTYLSTAWNILGNGYACALPLSRVEEVRGTLNLVYLGVEEKSVPLYGAIPFKWAKEAITIGNKTINSGALAFVFPDGDRLSMVMTATQDAKKLLYRYMPFSSRNGMPDYLVWDWKGVVVAGFFNYDFEFDPGLGIGL